MTLYNAWTDDGAKKVIEEAPERLRKSGWALLRPALDITVKCVSFYIFHPCFIHMGCRLWIMSGFQKNHALPLRCSRAILSGRLRNFDFWSNNLESCICRGTRNHLQYNFRTRCEANVYAFTVRGTTFLPQLDVSDLILSSSGLRIRWTTQLFIQYGGYIASSTPNY